MCIYIIPDDKLGNLATVINTKKTEIWTNQMKVILFNESQEQYQSYVDCSKTHDQFPDQSFWFCFNFIFNNSTELLC